jgi:quinol monooxygenase YgiN
MSKMFIKAAIIACVATVSITSVHAAEEPVVVISRFFVTPGKEAIFEERNRKIVERVRKTEPDIIYRLQRSKTNPSQYVYYEVYPSEAALERHSKLTLPAIFKEIGPPPEGLLARPRENESLQVLEP